MTPGNQDRFLIKVGRAIELLRQHNHAEQFERQFDLLLKVLANWLELHEGNWARAFLTAGESTLRFIVVRQQVRFEAEITDSLSDLGAQIANDPDWVLIKLSVRALPHVTEEAFQSFFDPAFILEYDGDRARSHRARESKP